jgi:hypothetical protein
MKIGTHGPNSDPGWVRRIFPNGQPYSDVTQLGGQISSAITPVINAGDHPFFSFKPPINGSTSQWQAAGDQIIGVCDPLLQANPGLNIYLTAWHEPENDMTGAQFVAIQNSFYTYLKGHSLFADRLLFGPVAMAYQWQTGRAVTNTSDWIPAHFDFRGVDAYTHAALPGGSLRNHAGYQRWLASVDDDREVFLVERGVSGLSDTDQLAVLQEDITDLRAAGAYGYLYWNSDTNGYTYHLGTQSAAYLSDVATQELAPPPPPPPPATYTQAQFDSAVAAATASGYANGVAAGTLTGETSAYQDVLAFLNNRLGSLGAS